MKPPQLPRKRLAPTAPDYLNNAERTFKIVLSLCVTSQRGFGLNYCHSERRFSEGLRVTLLTGLEKPVRSVQSLALSAF